MPHLPRIDLLVLGALALLVLGIGLRVVGQHGATPSAGAGGTAAPPLRVENDAGERAVVHVAGAVRRPGLYRLPPGARVADALKRAGGPTHRGDPNALNLAAKVTDGQRVLVPERPPPTRPSTVSAPGAATTQDRAPAPVDLNSATAEQLDALDGIGPTMAQKILEYREQHGGFSSVDELGEIPGIGPKRLETLRKQVAG